MWIDLIGCLAAGICLNVFHAERLFEFLVLCGHPAGLGLWIGSAVLGLSMASIFPSAVHLVEEFIHVSGKFVIVVSAVS